MHLRKNSSYFCLFEHDTQKGVVRVSISLFLYMINTHYICIAFDQQERMNLNKHFLENITCKQRC